MASTTEHPTPADDDGSDSARLAEPPGPSTASEDRIGSRIADRYVLEAQLGAGPIGEVFRARCEDGRAVAIKVLARKHCQDAHVVRRFLRAGEGARALDHPHVLRTFECGVDQGVPFICSELASGQPIDRALAGSPLTLRRLLTPLCEVLSALAHAHRQGLLHRCLKPSNVLVEHVDGVMTTKVADFDQGRLLKPVPGTGRTKRGDSCGAAEYMAPEQALTTQIDGRADVYAVGVMLYELLTGQVPFRGTRSDEILTKHQNDALIPPRMLRKDRTIPREVESICLRALAKQPADRYQSPREMSSAIRATLELFGARADLPIEEPESVLDANMHTVSKDRLTMPGEQLRSKHKVGVGAALLVSVCGLIWLSTPRERKDALHATVRGVDQATLSPSLPLVPHDSLAQARAHLQRGDARAALLELERAPAQVRREGAYTRLLGEALLRTGQRVRGEALLRSYLNTNPQVAERSALEALLATP